MAHARFLVGKNPTSLGARQSQDQRRAASCRSAADYGRDFLCAAHRYFQSWLQAGVFEVFWRLGLDEYDSLKGIKWEWQALDGAMTKAPLAARRLGQTRQTGRNQARSANC